MCRTGSKTSCHRREPVSLFQSRKCAMWCFKPRDTRIRQNRNGTKKETASGKKHVQSTKGLLSEDSMKCSERFCLAVMYTVEGWHL